MAVNRIASNAYSMVGAADGSSLPGPIAGQPIPAVAVIVFPMGNGAAWQQHIYQIAYESARVLLSPPRHERLLMANSN